MAYFICSNHLLLSIERWKVIKCHLINSVLHLTKAALYI